MRITRLHVLLLFTMYSFSGTGQIGATKELKAKSDSLLLASAGECLVANYYTYDGVHMDTIVVAYPALDNKDSLIYDTVRIEYFHAYNLKFYDTIINTAEVRFTLDNELIGIAGINFIEDSLLNRMNCDIIPEEEYWEILKRDRHRGVRHQSFIINSTGLVGCYAYTIRKYRRRRKGVTAGAVLIDLHSGDVLTERVFHIRM